MLHFKRKFPHKTQLRGLWQTCIILYQELSHDTMPMHLLLRTKAKGAMV